MSSTAQAARTAASRRPWTAWAAASTSSGRSRLPPSSTPYRMACPRPAGAAEGSQADSADSTVSSSVPAQASKSPCFIRPPRLPTDSSVSPGLELTAFQNLDLGFDGFQTGAATIQQFGATLVAGQQAVERQLPSFHGRDQAFQFGQGLLVGGWQSGSGRGRGCFGHHAK